MRFEVKYSYNLDILNFMNVLTGDVFYTEIHDEAYRNFAQRISESARNQINEAVKSHGSSMLGPFLTLVLSSIEGFEQKDLLKILGDGSQLHDSFSVQPYYNAEKWPTHENTLSLLLPVVKELEESGFREYWLSERFPLINEKITEIQQFAKEYHFQEELQFMLGPGSLFDSISLYLCSFASPHGIKLCGPRYISDVSFPTRFTLAISIHEMFHPPYDANKIKELINFIGGDQLIKHAFINQNPNHGYSTMEGFIEENVVEAMALHVCGKIGLEDDPFGYLEKHDGGSHVLSVILLEYFKKYPKDKDQTFQEYFEFIISRMPIGDLDVVCRRIKTEIKNINL